MRAFAAKQGGVAKGRRYKTTKRERGSELGVLQSMLLYVAVELTATRRRERASICCKAGGGDERPMVESHKARKEE